MNQITLIPYKLKFAFDARTSRGKMESKKSWLVRLENGEKIAWGECSTIPGLSVDGDIDYGKFKATWMQELNDFNPKSREEVLKKINAIVPGEYPGLKFGLETAFLDLLSSQPFKIFDNDFFRGKNPIPINGLIWMGNYNSMIDQINRKVKEGFKCIKIKVGSLEFETECRVIEYIRNTFRDEDLIIRLDANGAFSPEEALEKLKTLSKFNIHSIEQPVKPGFGGLTELMEESPIPIALDEELIGKYSLKDMEKVLEMNPDFIILKPALMGGLSGAVMWIELAKKKGIGWWMTSALESNIGLNAIAQLTAEYNPDIPQGLGTGMIYKNNFLSPLEIKRGHLIYNLKGKWKLL